MSSTLSCARWDLAWPERGSDVATQANLHHLSDRQKHRLTGCTCPPRRI